MGTTPLQMHAVIVRNFGGLDALSYELVPRPAPDVGQVVLRVMAASVGPWDAWVREGKSIVPQPLPLILGSDFSGTVETVGAGVSGFEPGDAVFGVTKSSIHRGLCRIRRRRGHR